MSYEYEEINRAIVQQNGIDNNINRGNLLREIDEVYALAEKLPEYEAKAKAFEKVAGIAYWYFERVSPEYADFSDYEGFYDDIKDEFKRLESGGSDD